MSAREIAARLRMAFPTVHRFLLTLESVGAVRRTRDNRFQIEFELASRFRLYQDIAGKAQPRLERMALELGETVNLAVLDRGQVLGIGEAMSSRNLRTGSRIGFRGPAYCTGLGKVLLANLDDGQIDEYLASESLVARGPRTITTPDRLLDELRKVRRKGYAIDDEESEQGVRCVAVPVRGHDRRVIAAMSVSGPRSRLDRATLPSLRVTLDRQAAAIHAALVGAPRARRRGNSPSTRQSRTPQSTRAQRA